MSPRPGDLLTSETLDAFEAALRQRGAADVVDALATGVSEASLSRAQDDLGFKLPDEAKLWWRWRNGGPSVLVPHVIMMSLEQAVSGYQTIRRQAQGLAVAQSPSPDPRLGDVDHWWAAGWLPFAGPLGYDMVALDCKARADGGCAVRRIDWSRPGEDWYAQRVAPSFGALVHHWTNMLIDGELRFDAEQSTWLWVSRNEILSAP